METTCLGVTVPIGEVDVYDPATQSMDADPALPSGPRSQSCGNDRHRRHDLRDGRRNSTFNGEFAASNDDWTPITRHAIPGHGSRTCRTSPVIRILDNSMRQRPVPTARSTPLAAS